MRWAIVLFAGLVMSPLFFDFSGDKYKAATHVTEAKNRMFLFKQGMALGKLKQNYSQIYTLGDGSKMRLSSVFGMDKVEIWSPSPRIPIPEEKEFPQDFMYFGTTNGKVYSVDPGSLEVKWMETLTGAPYSAQLLTACSNETNAFFAAYGAWESYLGSFDAKEKVLDVNMNPPITNGVVAMVASEDGKNVFVATDSMDTGYAGIVKYDAESLARVGTTTTSGIYNYINNGAATDGDYVYFTARDTASPKNGVVVKVDPADLSTVSTLNLGSGVVPGTVLVDEAKEFMYVSQDNTVSKKLYKIDLKSFTKTGEITLSYAAYPPGRGVIQKNTLLLVTYPTYKLIAVDLEKFTEKPESYALPYYGGVVVANDDFAYVGINKGSGGYGVLKIKTKDMSLSKEASLGTSAYINIRSGTYIKDKDKESP